MMKEDYKYLKSLAKQYPNESKAATEIINLQSILSLPKGTEHFITDLHGEYDQFRHVLKNGSGAIRRKIEEEFTNSISETEKKAMAALIYYPEEKLEQVLETEENMQDWYKVMLYRLIKVAKCVSSKYTRSKVRKAITKDFEYVIEELLTGRPDVFDQEAYYREIIRTVIHIGKAKELIIAICNLIRRMVVDHLHVVGDIFDRGLYPDLIMDSLLNYHSIDIQWGNHDISWMGAAAGNPALICNVIRISAKYGNLNLLEDGYGINLVPLARFAMSHYEKDTCESFKISFQEGEYDKQYAPLERKMHKAIAIMQFKLEGQMIKRHPEYEMDNRLLLDKIDIKNKTVEVEKKVYPLRDAYFPTIDWEDPYRLSEEEQEVLNRLIQAFLNCEKLQKHVQFLYKKGNLYKVYNGNLLYHGCVPFDANGDFTKVNVMGQLYSGKKLYDVLEEHIRKGYFSKDQKEKQEGLDILWYVWENKNSPVFGKGKMTTFERYFIADEYTHKEPKNPYYELIEKEEIVVKILKEFGLDGEESHIVNGHIPVEAKKGESPIKCNGKLLIIDGGFSKAYQPKTGIAGYTLIYNSYGLVIAAHEPFLSIEKAIEDGSDIISHTLLVEHVEKRKTVADTDIGKNLIESIKDLERLLNAFRDGSIQEEF